MEYLVPLAAVVVIGLLTMLLAGRIGRRASGGTPAVPTSGLPFEVGEERAMEAAGLMDEGAHRTVYGHIAQGRVMEAVRAYRSHTGRSLRDAVTDVQSLAAHPQVWRPRVEAPVDDPGAEGAEDRPVGRPMRAAAEPDQNSPDVEQGGVGDRASEAGGQAGSAAESGPGRRSPSAAGEGDAPLMVPTEWTAEPAPEAPAFDVEVVRGEGAVRVSSRDLPPWLRDQLAAMVRDGNLESAAVQLSSHSDLTVPEAFELLRRLREQREGR